MDFKPNKIIFYTRPWEVQFHLKLARILEKHYNCENVVFASFFSLALKIAEQENRNTIYIPYAFNKYDHNQISSNRINIIDDYCRKRFHNINTMLDMERFLPKGRAQKNVFLKKNIGLLDELIEEKTLSISSMYDHFFYLLAGLLSFMKNGRHYAFVGCGNPPNRVLALKTPSEIWQTKVTDEIAMNILEKTRQGLSVPSEKRISYMKPGPINKTHILRKLYYAHKRSFYYKTDKANGSYFVGGQDRWVIMLIKSFIKRLKADFSSPPWDIPSSSELRTIKEQTVFLGLHMEPEATLFMYSPMIRNQVEAVRVVSNSLPQGYKLLIKENPKMHGRRSSSYYKKIKDFPNVLLISTKIPSYELIQKSEATVSIAGNASLEARLQGKKSFCLGTPPFHKMVKTGIETTVKAIRYLDTSQNNDEASLQREWVQWVSGTFEVYSFQKFFNKQFGFFSNNCEPKTVASYFEFIITSF